MTDEALTREQRQAAFEKAIPPHTKVDLPDRDLLVPVETSAAVIIDATPDQRESLKRLMHDRRPTKATVYMGTGGLPDDYLYVILEFPRGVLGQEFEPAPFHCGIDPAGRVSS